VSAVFIYLFTDLTRTQRDTWVISVVTGTGSRVDWWLKLCSLGYFQAFCKHILFIKKLANIFVIFLISNFILLLQSESAFWLHKGCMKIRFSQKGIAGIKKTAVLYGRVWFWLQEEVFLFMTAFVLVGGLGLCGQYSGWLQVGWSGDKILMKVRFSTPIQTNLGVRPLSFMMGTGLFQEG
jgi:hypothetical protein